MQKYHLKSPSSVQSALKGLSGKGVVESYKLLHPLHILRYALYVTQKVWSALFYFSSPLYPLRFFFASIGGEIIRSRYGEGTERVRWRYEEGEIVLFVGLVFSRR